MPDHRHLPASIRELQQTVAWAVDSGTPLAVHGNATKAGYGRDVEAEHVLSTTALSGIDMYEPAELVMSAGAGTPLAEIEAALAERGQMLAFEPADLGLLVSGKPGAQTIGGAFAVNLAGPRRIKSGAARDHLLGLQIVTGHGQIIKSGGRVVKNVTGYDLCKLLTGSFGTLAVMSHVTFKVLPAPADEATLVLHGGGRDALLAKLRQAMGTSYEVSSAAFLPAHAAGRASVDSIAAARDDLAVLRLEGHAESVAYRIERLQATLVDGKVDADRLAGPDSRALWQDVRHCALLDHARPCLWRISVPPADASAVSDRLAPLGGESFHDWAGGLIWLALDEIHEAAVRGAVTQGHATLLRAPDEQRRAASPFQPQPAPLRALSERVKDSFDPKRVLNPGRMYQGI